MLVFWSGWQDKQPEDTQPSWHCSRHRQGDPQDTAKRGSTMQKTGWTIHSFFLVLSGLEKGFTLDVITRGQSCVLGHFRHGATQLNKRTTR